MKLVCFGVLVVLFFTQCSKFGDTEKPIITINSPLNQDTIPGAASEVIMQFTATDNKSLSSLILEISDSNGNKYFSDTKSIFGTSYNYKNSFSIAKHSSKYKELTMTVHIIDETNNEAISSTTFFIAP